MDTAAPQPPLVGSAERRQLTVLFCDLVGSTALSARLDPEDMREIIGAYHRCCAERITKAGGFVAKYMGDGVLAYFGYPQAHEDDAERAVRSGLSLTEAVSKLRTEHDAALQVRIGVATGLVVVGDLIGEGDAQERGVVGDTPNLAARLQSLAEPGQVVISSNTRHLTGGLFEYHDLGKVSLKGLDDPVQAWQVLGASAVESRFEAQHGAALTPLVGREEELELLLRRWQQAKAGDGAVVLISGEPGIGKSRIVQRLLERLGTEPHTRLRQFCSPHHQDTALYPTITQLERAAGFRREDTDEQRLDKLEAVLAQATNDLSGAAPLLAQLLSVPTEGRYPALDLTPQKRKEKTFKALIAQLAGLAARQPVVMVYEDAHWIDPTSLELLDLTVDHVPSLPVLLIITFRPEFTPSWVGRPQVMLLTLSRLPHRQRAEMVSHLTGGKALPREIADQIVNRTDGVPLFIEELTKAVVESGGLADAGDHYTVTRWLSPLAIPTTLHASLLARLDRLAPVREVAQIGAALGRHFSHELISAVAPMPQKQLDDALAQLVSAELVFRRGTPPDAEYTFKHALVQDAAYSTLLRSSRQQLHAQIADALETRFPELMENQPELFAHHYAEAGLVENSVAYWGKAGHRSAGRSAMSEAAAQFQKGLDQLALLPKTPERQRQELELTSALGAALLAVKGLSAPETGHAYAHARELWEQLGSPIEFLHVPYGQSRYHAFRGELDLALRLAEDLVRLSLQRNDSGGLLLGHFSSGRNLMLLGRFASSRSHLEDVLELYDPISHAMLVHQAGTDLHAVSRVVLGICLFCLGCPDQALAQSKAAIAEARALAHAPSLAVTLTFGAILLSLVGDMAALNAWSDQLVAVSAEQGFPVWHSLGIIYRGWVKVNNGEVAEGTSLLGSGSEAYRATGAETMVPYHLALLARACAIAGQVDEPVTLLDDALRIAERTGERWLAAELHSHKGQLLRRRGHFEAAEELYRKALSIAQEQGAKLWELRAAVSLSRLWRDQVWMAFRIRANLAA